MPGSLGINVKRVRDIIMIWDFSLVWRLAGTVSMVTWDDMTLAMMGHTATQLDSSQNRIPIYFSQIAILSCSHGFEQTRGIEAETRTDFFNSSFYEYLDQFNSYGNFIKPFSCCEFEFSIKYSWPILTASLISIS